MAADAKQEWLDGVAEALGEGTLVKITLGAPRRPDAEVRKVLARPVDLRGGRRLQVVWQLATHDVTKNLEPGEGVARISELIGTDFCIGNLFTTRRTAQVEFRKGRAGRVTYGAAVAGEPDTAHDRRRERAISADRPWLRDLGVTAADGSVCRGQESKLRQIHRFVELMDPLLVESGLVGASTSSEESFPEPLRVWDMGCGKGYLTFALHEHLRMRTGRPVRTRGIEARPALVDLANRVARESGCDGLEFLSGTIANVPRDGADVLVALHACDTATDDALAAGVASKARMIVVSPCCHREIRSQLVPPPVLQGPLRHGILLEREAEFVTDGLRAGLLDWAGWDPRVFEFVSSEHTAKNLMIAAVRRRESPDPAAAARRVREFAGFYGVRRQHLSGVLGFDLAEGV
ncbi:MAG: SAM-dependent methyltransferase [Verrucomicrobiales bacterium]|nr:SAM-dependent methyltransferase [Verrucomicrobiales bacterium]